MITVGFDGRGLAKFNLLLMVACFNLDFVLFIFFIDGDYCFFVCLAFLFCYVSWKHLTLEASMLLHYSIHIFTYRFSVFLCISAFLVIPLQKMSIEVTLYIHIFLKKNIYVFFSNYCQFK